MKICTGCKKEKHTDEFGVNSSQPDKLQRQCKECVNAGKRRRRLENPEHFRRKCFKDRYKIDAPDINLMKESQDEKCAICKKEFTKETSMCIDHCHQTNKIRGLLCRKCNFGLGLFEDNIENLLSAAEYLAK